MPTDGARELKRRRRQKIMATTVIRLAATKPMTEPAMAAVCELLLLEDTGVDDPAEGTLEEDVGLTDALEELRIEPGPNSGESRIDVE